MYKSCFLMLLTHIFIVSVIKRPTVYRTGAEIQKYFCSFLEQTKTSLSRKFRFLLTFSREKPNIVGNKTSETLLTLGIQAEAQKFSSSAMLSCQKKSCSDHLNYFTKKGKLKWIKHSCYFEEWWTLSNLFPAGLNRKQAWRCSAYKV